MDRRHWLLLLAALACLAGLVLWIGEIDLGLDDSLNPPPTASPGVSPGVSPAASAGAATTKP